MQYVHKNGLKISKFTLGTVQLGMEYGIANKSGKPNEATSFSILQAAVQGGVNSFDTSLHYGDSEVVLGSFFSSGISSLREPVITTKFKLAKGDLAEGVKLSDSAVEKQIYKCAESSLERLKINKIPIYMLHEPSDMLQYGRIIAKTLEKLKNEGLVKIAAVSVYTTDEVFKMLKNDVYEAVQAPMNVFDSRLTESGALKRLYIESKMIFVRSIFLQGLFFMNPDSLTGVLKDAQEPLAKLAKLAEEEGMSIAQLALSYIRDMKEVTSLVIGAETPEQVMDNLRLMEGPGISERTVNEIETCFRGMPVNILNPGLWKR